MKTFVSRCHTGPVRAAIALLPLAIAACTTTPRAPSEAVIAVDKDETAQLIERVQNARAYSCPGGVWYCEMISRSSPKECSCMSQGEAQFHVQQLMTR